MSIFMEKDNRTYKAEAAIWKAVRAFRVFTLEDLEQFELCPPAFLRNYLERLERAGFLRTWGGMDSGRIGLANDPGPMPPRLDMAGQGKQAGSLAALPGATNPEPILSKKNGAWIRPIVEFCGKSDGVVMLSELLQSTGIPRAKALPVLSRLCDEGHLERVPAPKGSRIGSFMHAEGAERAYRVLGDVGKRRIAQHGNSARNAMWAVMWERKRFTATLLRKLTKCSRNAAIKYIALVLKHGYAEKAGMLNNKALYVLTDKATESRPKTPKSS